MRLLDAINLAIVGEASAPDDIVIIQTKLLEQRMSAYLSRREREVLIEYIEEHDVNPAVTTQDLSSIRYPPQERANLTLQGRPHRSFRHRYAPGEEPKFNIGPLK